MTNISLILFYEKYLIESNLINECGSVEQIFPDYSQLFISDDKNKFVS